MIFHLALILHNSMIICFEIYKILILKILLVITKSSVNEESQNYFRFVGL